LKIGFTISELKKKNQRKVNAVTIKRIKSLTVYNTVESLKKIKGTDVKIVPFSRSIFKKASQSTVSGMATDARLKTGLVLPKISIQIYERK